MEIGGTETKKVNYADFEKLRWIKNKLAREWIQLARGLCTLCDSITRESCILSLEFCGLCHQDVSVWICINSSLQMYS